MDGGARTEGARDDVVQASSSESASVESTPASREVDSPPPSRTGPDEIAAVPLSMPTAQVPMVHGAPAPAHPSPLPAAVDSAPVAPAGTPSGIARYGFHILAGTVVVLLLAMAGGGYWARSQIMDRNRTIASYAELTADLETANTAFQAEVDSLTDQRDALTLERDALTVERDALATERDEFEAQVATLEQRVASLEGTLDERNRELGQAREETSRQQSRAQSAEAFGLVLAQVVDLDDQIHREFMLLLEDLDLMHTAYRNGSQSLYQAAHDRATNTALRLDELMRQRQWLLDQLT